ncbi:MAG: MFS transporter [Burkholderiaceae bacterium]|jgi:MFS family permease|nr:MFS transporter [Burkholderiaceae bacterium]
MTGLERRASFSLATIFSLRMLGLFLVLPVFALEAAHLPGGHDPFMTRLAMGIYGLTQAMLQIPLGLASDRYGRKRVIVLGLIVFGAGSVLAACAGSIVGLIAGRALQGAGAISAAVTALLADLTRDEVRTKGMAMVGASIGLIFALSLMVAPTLDNLLGGLSGLFTLTALLALLGIVVVVWVTPPEPRGHAVGESRGRIADVWAHSHLWRLYLGVFALHMAQMSMWGVVPGLLAHAGLPIAQHWHVYLPAVLLSFIMLVVIFGMERGGHLRAVLRGGIALLLLVQLALWRLAPQWPGAWTIGIVLFFFFVAFNVLEATQPSLVSRLAPAHARGAALGIYNTLQALGLFAGGALGGLLFKYAGPAAVFEVTTALAALWLILAWPQVVPLPRSRQRQPQPGEQTDPPTRGGS